MNICVECKHCKSCEDAWILRYKCKQQLISIDPVTGYKWYRECEDVRVADRAIECDMFERKQSWIYRLFT